MAIHENSRCEECDLPLVLRDHRTKVKSLQPRSKRGVPQNLMRDLLAISFGFSLYRECPQMSNSVLSLLGRP